MSFNLGLNEYIFHYISPRSENIFAKICGISNKNATWELDVSYAVAGLYKNMILDFIDKRSKKLNFETFEKFYSLQLIQKL